MYAVVEFLEEDTVEAVPQSWLKGDKICYWPPSGTKLSDVKKMIKHSKVPELNWRACCVKTVKENIDGFYKALHKAQKVSSGRETSTDNENLGRGKQRKIQHKQIGKLVSSSDESASDEENPVLRKIMQLLPSSPVLPSTSGRSVEHVGFSSPKSIPVTRPLVDDDTQQSAANASTQTTSVHLFPNSFTAENEGLKSILRELALVRATQARHSELLRVILEEKSSTVPSEVSEDMNELLQKFPIKNKGESLLLEKELQKSGNERILRSKLKNFGGANYADHTCRIFKISI